MSSDRAEAFELAMPSSDVRGATGGGQMPSSDVRGATGGGQMPSSDVRGATGGGQMPIDGGGGVQWQHRRRAGYGVRPERVLSDMLFEYVTKRVSLEVVALVCVVQLPLRLHHG